MWVQIWHDLSSARAPRPPARPRVLSVSDLARDNRHADTSRARVCSRPRSRVRGSGWASSRSAAVACGFFFHLAHLHHHRLSQLSNQTVTCPLPEKLRSKRRTQKPCGSAPVMTGLRRSSARTSRRTTHRATHTHTHTDWQDGDCACSARAHASRLHRGRATRTGRAPPPFDRRGVPDCAAKALVSMTFESLPARLAPTLTSSLLSLATRSCHRKRT